MPGEPQVTGVRLDDLYRRACEALPQYVGPGRMELDGDDTRAALDQVLRDCAGARADVEHQVALRDTGAIDEAPGPAVS